MTDESLEEMDPSEDPGWYREWRWYGWFEGWRRAVREILARL